MSPKMLSLVALAAISLVLTSCVRSASTPPPTGTVVASGTQAGTPGAQNTQSGATEDPLAALALGATQTFQAASGTIFPPTAPAAGGTPGATAGGVVLPTATPVVAGTQPVVVGTPAPTYTAPPLVKPQTYALQKGEFPYCIARRFNVNPQELLTLNNLASGELFEPGQTLQIPQSSLTFPGERALIPSPATYTVISGDTIYGVACKYGDVDPMAIAAANGLLSPYTLTAGQTLQIP